MIKRIMIKRIMVKRLMNHQAGKETGSLTVEACIIFPVFLFFILFLLLGVQLACITMALDHGVSETAKKLATSAYPLSLLNEMEEELLPGEQLPANFLPELNTLLSEGFNTSYHDLKGQGKYRIAEELLKQYLTGSLVKKDYLILRQVELPASDPEFESRKKSADDTSETLIPGKDYDQDDVVIQVEYHFRVPLPFAKQPLALRHTAVEKAWLYGGNGVYTNQAEKGIFSETGQTVYITRTGSKYHLRGCMYLRKSKIPIYLADAKKDHQPCKVCATNN